MNARYQREIKAHTNLFVYRDIVSNLHSFRCQVNRETIGQDVATAGSGFAMLATSFGSLAGPPLAGFLYGETKSYKNIFYVAG